MLGVESEHVEVLSLCLVGLLQPLVAHPPVEYLPHVLHDKLPLRYVAGCLQPPPACARVEGDGVGILALPHVLVVAEQPHGAGLGVALHVDGTVDADRVVVARVLRCALAGERMEVVVRYCRPLNQILIGLHTEGGE